MNFRAERVSNLIRDELSIIVIREVEFPADTIATLTEVGVDNRLEHARVKVSVIPSEKSAEVLKILGQRAGELQYMLLKKLNIKPMPRIRFEIDHGPEDAAHIEKILLDK